MAQIKLAAAAAATENVKFLDKTDVTAYIEAANAKIKQGGSNVASLPENKEITLLPTVAVKDIVIQGNTYSSPITYGVIGDEVYPIGITCFRKTSYVGVEKGKAVVTACNSLPIPETIKLAAACVEPWLTWVEKGKVVSFQLASVPRTITSVRPTITVIGFNERAATSEEIKKASKVLADFKSALAKNKGE